MEAAQLTLLHEDVQTPEGMQYIEGYIPVDEQAYLLLHVDKAPWLKDLKRRVQHYGFKYNYKARKVDMSMCLGELPEWLKYLSRKLYSDGHMPEIADQVIVNEYEPGQGISAHTDCEPCFGDNIASISLGSHCVMDFECKTDENKKYSEWLDPGSLIVLHGEARYNWLHKIPARSSDKRKGHLHKRGRRVSLTFRKVIISKGVS